MGEFLRYVLLFSSIMIGGFFFLLCIDELLIHGGLQKKFSETVSEEPIQGEKNVKRQTQV